MLDRVEPRRSLDQPRQHRRLAYGEVLGPAVKEVHARGAQAVDVVAEIGVRQIAREDLVLGQPAFEPEGDQHLARLAGERLFGGQKGELGELLGDGRAAAHPHEHRARHAARIDAPMVVEAPVLDRHECLDHMRW